MLRHAPLLALLVAPLAAPLAAQAPFEGALAMTLATDDGKSHDVAYLVKGSKIRMEMPGARGETMVMIFDMAEKKMLIMMDAQKMYMEQAFNSEAIADAAAKAKPAKIERTGNFETIAGYKCEHLTVTEPDESKSDVCVAKGMGSFRMPGAGGPRGGAPKAEGWQSALGDGGFPLKVQKGTKVTLEVKSVDKKSLGAALFAAPDGYTKMDMGGMMRRRP
jgi:hypothetical protein